VADGALADFDVAVFDWAATTGAAVGMLLICMIVNS
jgi:hypothetical protein